MRIDEPDDSERVEWPEVVGEPLHDVGDDLRIEFGAVSARTRRQWPRDATQARAVTRDDHTLDAG